MADDPEGSTGRFDAGRITVRIDRGDYWQCAVVIKKGSFDQIRDQGLDAFRENLADMLPFAGDRVSGIADWDDIKLLTVQVDRLQRWWRPGLLCIGDAAHAMSPVGGVGINLAIQDAVAAANLLADPLRAGNLGTDPLKAVQARRNLPTKVTQWFQVQAQERILKNVLSAATAFKPPFAVRCLDRFPVLRRLPARLVGLGVRPEHVLTHSIEQTVDGTTDMSKPFASETDR